MKDPNQMVKPLRGQLSVNVARMSQNNIDSFVQTLHKNCGDGEVGMFEVNQVSDTWLIIKYPLSGKWVKNQHRLIETIAEFKEAGIVKYSKFIELGISAKRNEEKENVLNGLFVVVPPKRGGDGGSIRHYIFSPKMYIGDRKRLAAKTKFLDSSQVLSCDENMYRITVPRRSVFIFYEIQEFVKKVTGFKKVVKFLGNRVSILNPKNPEYPRNPDPNVIFYIGITTQSAKITADRSFGNIVPRDVNDTLWKDLDNIVYHLERKGEINIPDDFEDDDEVEDDEGGVIDDLFNKILNHADSEEDTQEEEIPQDKSQEDEEIPQDKSQEEEKPKKKRKSPSKAKKEVPVEEEDIVVTSVDVDDSDGSPDNDEDIVVGE